MPSLAILFPAGTRVAAIGEKARSPRTEEVFDREDVPSVMGKDVDDQQVDIVERIESPTLAVGAVGRIDLIAGSTAYVTGHVPWQAVHVTPMPCSRSASSEVNFEGCRTTS